MSTIRVPPNDVRSTTMPWGSARMSPMSTASDPSGWRRSASTAASASLAATTASYSLSHGRYHADYVCNNTNAPLLIKEGYSFNEQDGVFSGWDPAKKSYDKSSWSYELDGQNMAKIDLTMEHPRSVFQLMKQHYSRYTPEMVSRIC